MTTRRPVRILANIGDCFAIPLRDGRIAYAQYVLCHEEFASLVQVFDLITEKEQSVEDLITAKPLFPPVFVGFNDAVRKKCWRIIGNLPVREFRFPLFRSTQGITHWMEPGVFHDWLLWDGKRYTRLGDLPPEYRALEYLVSWASDHLEERIATGRNFPFGSMH